MVKHVDTGGRYLHAGIRVYFVKWNEMKMKNSDSCSVHWVGELWVAGKNKIYENNKD